MTTKINATTSGLIETVDTSGVLEFQTANSSALVIGTDQNANFTGTTAITVPNGTTAQRPTPVNGMMRYNTSLSIFEVYANNTWSAANVTPTPVNTVAPVISGSAIVGQNLTSTTGTWSGSPSAYYYQWLANSTAISGQTANVITLTLAENGANITCNVIAYNVAGNSTPATSNTLGPVINGIAAKALVVGGGGAGGTFGGGGGGAGAIVYSTSLLLTPATTYPVIVGAGGSKSSQINGGSSGLVLPTSGSNSSISTLTATGGGFGASYNAVSSYSPAPASGGSGGGWGGTNNGTGASATGSSGGSTDAVSGANGWGNAGGNTGSVNGGGGGGGGAGAAGASSSGTNNTAGAGGAGLQYTISGTSTYYAGGGGGGGYGVSSGGGAGGTGGGGAGGPNADTNGVSGTANTGGGGGGQTSNGGSGTYYSGAGGSGVVIISYAGAQQFGGGVISTDGSNTIHTFYTSGSLVPLTALNSSYIIVGGGGGGGAVCGGGGGGGGFYSGSNVTIDANSTYTIVVGAGGTAGPTAASSFGGAGGNSTFSMTSNVAIGGGYGGGGFYSVAAYNGGNGASGGGGGGYWSMGQTSGGTGTAGQGYNGGNALNGTGYPGGGGGGFSSAGANATASQGGNGGNGVSSSISGTLTYYAGGGGGGTSAGSAGAAGLGGAAGSGSGAGSSASAGTGGGGGGGNQSSAGGAGGSGTVIISYPGSTPMMAGGNVTVVSNTVVHTFTSSGYLTPFVNMNNSLRFRQSNSAYLSRTPTTAGNRKTWTWSGWVKRGALSSLQALESVVNGGNEDSFAFLSADTLRFYGAGQASGLTTNAVFRDPAAWYHVVLAMDTTQATASNRTKLYVNGIQQTFSGSDYLSQNTDTAFNSTAGHYIGRYLNQSMPTGNLDGYVAELNFIDGQALTPNAFGSFNQYGVWAPVRYAGSYGTNGFYLPFNPYAQGYTGYFNGSSYITTGTSSGLAFGTGDFTVEFFTNIPSYPSIGGFVDISTSNTTGRFVIDIFTAGYVTVETAGVTLLTGNTQLPLNRWVHIAVVRSGTTLAIFQNGINIGTVTNSTNFSFTSGTIGINVGPAYGITGYMSNLRIVKGTAVYNPSATSITVPTSALTAISGTSLLTLQNSTIVDNSGNSVTLTNTGVTTGQTYPLSTAVFNDQSPQGNNWTPNNIGGGFNYSLDYMVDVPTLTSANVANYCVLNPIAGPLTNGTVSDGNLKITCAFETDKGCVSTIAPYSGKWYWEATILNTSGTGNTYLGIMYATASSDVSANRLFLRNDGQIYKFGTYIGTTGTTATINDVMGVALDVSAQTLAFYKNGTLLTTVSTIGTTPFYPWFGGYTSSDAWGVNFGQQPFTYTPPTDYLPLNTYNM